MNEYRIINKIKKCPCCSRNTYVGCLIEDGRIKRKMKKEGICYDCAYWIDLFEYPPDHLEIVGNKAYKVLPEKDDSTNILGNGGEYKYLLKRDGTLLKSNDVWLIGTIPNVFLLGQRPTGCWIPENIYRKLIKHPHQCFAEACMDRYHCYRYDYRREFNTKPFNHVPSDWKVGGERCKYFINIAKIPEYDDFVRVEDIID